MKHCPLYNGQNLDFTGNENPYGLIQLGGKRKSKRRYNKKSMRKRRIKRGTRKYKR